MLDQESVWRSFRADRAQYLKTNMNKDCSGFLPKAEIELNQRKIEQKFQMFNISDEKNFSLSKKQINFGAELFMTLNTCSDFYRQIYLNAFYGPQSRIVQLSLNIYKKSTTDFKEKAKKIFAKVTSALEFEYIQHTMNANGRIEFTKNMQSVRGKY